MAAKKGTTARVKAGSAKVVDKNTINVNLSGVEARKRRTTQIPEGNYAAKVIKAESFTSKGGNPGVKWEFELADGKYKGSKFWYNTMLVEQSIWSFRGVLQSLSPAVKIPDKTMQIDLRRLADRTCALEIVDGEYEGKVRSEINDVFHESMLEAQSDEDEDLDEDEDEEEDEDFDDEEDDEDEEDEEEDWDDEEIDLDDED